MEILSPVVVRFATAYVPSIDDLKLLILLVEERERWLDASTIARTLAMPRDTARAALDHLARRNLLDMRITGDLRYRFRPGAADLETQVLALVDAYRRNPSAVLELVESHSAAKSPR